MFWAYSFGNGKYLYLGCTTIKQCMWKQHLKESMNVHFLQGNFFQNFGSIILFAVVGTLISALIVGGGVYLLGQVSSVCVCEEDFLNTIYAFIQIYYTSVEFEKAIHMLESRLWGN